MGATKAVSSSAIVIDVQCRQAIYEEGGQPSDKHADRTLEVIGRERVVLTDEDSRRIRRKTDKVILAILCWVYFLQILDKSYSLIGSIAGIAQIAWQPFSSFLIVKVPHRILMPALCLGWGIAQSSLAACHNFRSLMIARFFLGLFGAGCLPLFGIIASRWYRRSEQPLRIAAWYSTNGVDTMVAAALSYGLGHIQSEVLQPWQIIFLFVGLGTIVTAIERQRANQTGTGNQEFKIKHVVEAALEPKTYLWISMSMILNVGAGVTNVFGRLILNGLGYDKYTTSLLNMPFGAIQLVVILVASYLAQKAHVSVLYALPRSHSVQAALIVGYYLLAFLYGGNPLIVTWIVGNTAGTTKKYAILSFYNAASAAGGITAPLLFNKKDAPTYHPGLRACVGTFVALVAVVLIQWTNLVFPNKVQERKRLRNGKKAKVIDHSMQDHYHSLDKDKYLLLAEQLLLVRFT
ncbi:major facilitator superfamily domain-containing protein [Lipomyces doorenjongii]|uniref:major facilitator superfamily domain-containing protein n=1 Tax=Lipomyces doorenjongii TaxID=383834 RepID=UPI0034CDC380